MMKTFIANAQAKLDWYRTVRYTHAQRRFDQLSMLIDGAESETNLHHYGELADEFERRYLNSPYGDRFVATLCGKLHRRAQYIYNKPLTNGNTSTTQTERAYTGG